MAFASPWRGFSALDLGRQNQVLWTSIDWKTVEDALQTYFFRRVHQGVRCAFSVCAPCSPNAMHVIVRHARHIEVDHNLCLRNIDATCTDVGADQHPSFAFSEP